MVRLIYFYPNRPSFIPKDDKDLVLKAFKIYEMCGDIGVFKYLAEMHPHLEENVKIELANKCI
mgnify:CR=1 FL=1|jgi:hypothetical protein